MNLKTPILGLFGSACNILGDTLLHEQELLRAQDDADFKLMYEQLVPVLYRVAYNVVREEDIAEGLCMMPSLQ